MFYIDKPYFVFFSILFVVVTIILYAWDKWTIAFKSLFILAILLLFFSIFPYNNQNGYNLIGPQVILGGFRGKNLDDLQGEFKISGAQITNENRVVNLNPITISQKFSEDITQLTIINTDCISGAVEGKFKTSQLWQIFQQTLRQDYPFLSQKSYQKPQQTKLSPSNFSLALLSR